MDCVGRPEIFEIVKWDVVNSKKSDLSRHCMDRDLNTCCIVVECKRYCEQGTEELPENIETASIYEEYEDLPTT